MRINHLDQDASRDDEKADEADRIRVLVQKDRNPQRAEHHLKRRDHRRARTADPPQAQVVANIPAAKLEHAEDQEDDPLGSVQRQERAELALHSAEGKEHRCHKEVVQAHDAKRVSAAHVLHGERQERKPDAR